MAKKAKKSKRGRQQDRARVAGRQDYEVGYAAKKTGKSRGAVRKAVKKVGSSRKKVERVIPWTLEKRLAAGGERSPRARRRSCGGRRVSVRASGRMM